MGSRVDETRRFQAVGLTGFDLLCSRTTHTCTAPHLGEPSSSLPSQYAASM
jgi:hypothetical protein